ncbi:MAG: hypothetical protein V4714_20555 [Bacteroidota bacterium]
MSTLKQLVEPYIVHAYEGIEKPEKFLEVAVYSLDATDGKFRIMKFVNKAMKEFHTTDDREEAMAKFKQLLA